MPCTREPGPRATRSRSAATHSPHPKRCANRAAARAEPIQLTATPERPRKYPAGTTGPTAAATLLERDGRAWQETDQ